MMAVARRGTIRPFACRRRPARPPATAYDLLRRSATEPTTLSSLFTSMSSSTSGPLHSQWLHGQVQELRLSGFNDHGTFTRVPVYAARLEIFFEGLLSDLRR